MNILAKVGKNENREISENYIKSFIKRVKVEIPTKSSFFTRFTGKFDTIRILWKNLRKFNDKYFLEILEPLRRRANYRRMRRRVTLLELSYERSNYFAKNAVLVGKCTPSYEFLEI